MSVPLPPGATADGLTIGRGALQQLHQSLQRDAADQAINILQEAGFAAGEGVYNAFRAWLSSQGLTRPEDIDAAQLNDVLSAFFQSTGWGTVTLGPLSGATLAVDTSDWAEAEPGTAQMPMCFFSAGMLADFLGRLSGETVAVMEVECRSRSDARCRFLSASPETLNAVYERMAQGTPYEQAVASG